MKHTKQEENSERFKMIRHIFMGTFKRGISDDVKQKELEDLRAMKDRMPSVANLEVGFTTGWEGMPDSIALTADFRTKADFEAYKVHPYHADYINQTGTDYFDRSTFLSVQFEF